MSFIKSRSRLFADLVNTFYASGTTTKSVEQKTVQAENDSITTVDTVPTSAASAVTFYVNSFKDNDYHFAIVTAVLSSPTDCEYTEFGTIITNSALAEYSVDINSSNFRLRANPATTGVTFKVTRIVVEA